MYNDYTTCFRPSFEKMLTIATKLGWFLDYVVTLVGRTRLLAEEEATDTRDKLSCPESYSKAQPSDLGFEVNHSFDLKMPEGEQRSFKLDVLLKIIEVLMEYAVGMGVDSFG